MAFIFCFFSSSLFVKKKTIRFQHSHACHLIFWLSWTLLNLSKYTEWDIAFDPLTRWIPRPCSYLFRRLVGDPFSTKRKEKERQFGFRQMTPPPSKSAAMAFSCFSNRIVSYRECWHFFLLSISHFNSLYSTLPVEILVRKVKVQKEFKSNHYSYVKQPSFLIQLHFRG